MYLALIRFECQCDNRMDVKKMQKKTNRSSNSMPSHNPWNQHPNRIAIHTLILHLVVCQSNLSFIGSVLFVLLPLHSDLVDEFFFQLWTHSIKSVLYWQHSNERERKNANRFPWFSPAMVLHVCSICSCVRVSVSKMGNCDCCCCLWMKPKSPSRTYMGKEWCVSINKKNVQNNKKKSWQKDR